MTYKFCDARPNAVAAGPMEHELWQVRARQAGLSQKALALLAGVAENTVSRQLRGQFGAVPNYLKTIIRAWEMLTDEQREALRAAAEGSDDFA